MLVIKKVQFIHMLTATDLRTSKTAKILLYHCISSYVNVQQYSKITFLFLLFPMCEGLSPLTYVVFFTLIFAVFLLMSSPISCRSISRPTVTTVNQTFDYLVVNLC